MGEQQDGRFTPSDAALIRHKARRLVGHHGYRSSDVEDLEQDLMLHVLRQSHRPPRPRVARGIHDHGRTGGPLAGAVVVDGATDTGVFVAWVEHALVPHLRPGETVVMDNLRPHHSPRVRELIESMCCRMLYLPPYSPDFNPIEPMWSKVKGHLRSAAARTYEALQQAVTDAPHAVTPNDCHGFFRHCSYDAA
ncbi:MAG TPA: transposase [Tepidisphaeraceae bacterium]|nr:transposase [Tepidisphaeraceae bacterium]